MDLEIVPFTDQEQRTSWRFNEFTENGVLLTMLMPSVSNPVVNSGNMYKIGFQDATGKLFWFFKGKPKVRSRTVAIEMFKILQQGFIDKNKGLRLFIFKVKK